MTSLVREHSSAFAPPMRADLVTFQRLRVRERSRGPSIALCGGGTGGHVMTAVAIAESIRDLDPTSRVFLLGCEQGLEREILADHPLPLEVIPCAPVAGTSPLGKGLAVLETLHGTWMARGILLRNEVQLAIGVGAFASVPGILAARSLGIPTAIVEVNARPGLANRFLSRLVDVIYLAQASTSAHFPAGRCTVTGTPVRSAIPRPGRLRLRASRQDPRPLILVTGGSLGSEFLNRECPPLLGQLAALGTPIRVVHQTGRCGGADLAASYRAAGIEATVGGYFDDFHQRLAEADFVISSPGAITLAEIAVAGTPCLLVPNSGVAEGHHVTNVLELASAMRVPFELEETWMPDRIARDLQRRLRCPESLKRESHRLKAAFRGDAGRRIAADGLARLHSGA